MDEAKPAKKTKNPRHSHDLLGEVARTDADALTHLTSHKTPLNACHRTTRALVRTTTHFHQAQRFNAL
jgi:hypothetical protein